MLTKISKIAKFILLVLLFSIGMIYVVFRSTPVQTWLAGRAASILSDQLGTRVSIGGVDIEFFKTAVLENVYIEDRHGDTMFYFRRIRTDYNSYDKDKRIIRLNHFGIEGGKILFGEHQGDSVNNYEFFIDFFDGGPRDPNKPKVIWTIYSKTVELERVRFDYFSRNQPAPASMVFNYNDMSYRDIYGTLKDFYLIDDSLSFKAEHLETTEKCGFRMDHFSAQTKIHEGGIEFYGLDLRTPNSRLGDVFAMRTTDWKDYRDFNSKVRLLAHFEDAGMHTRDLWYFSDRLRDWNTLITLDGAGEGVLERLKGKNTSIGLFGHTRFQGNWSMTGLPDFDNTILDFDVREFRTDYEDLNKLSLQNIPSNFKSLGSISYKGMFSGFYNDFISYGTLKTEIGNFNTDINVKFKDGMEKAVYKGSMKTDRFLIRSFIPEAQIESIAFAATISGKGLSLNSYAMKVDAVVPAMTFMGNEFKDILANGELSRRSFSGKATIRDQHLDMDFDGSFLSDLKVPEAHFSAAVRKLDLKAFGLDKSQQIIKGNFNLDFKGTHIDESEGSIVGEQVSISRNGVTVDIPYINLSAYDYDKIRELRLRSDLVDASVKGRFKLGLMNVSIMHMMHQLIPAFFDKPARSLPDEDFVYDFDLKKPLDITNLYYPELSMEPFKGKGFYRSSDQTLELGLNNKNVTFGDYVFSNVRVRAKRLTGEKLNFEVEIEDFTDRQNLHIRNLDIRSAAIDNIINFSLNGIDTGYKIGLHADGKFLFVQDSVRMTLSDVVLGLAEQNWLLDRTAAVTFTGGDVLIHDFVFRNKMQMLALGGDLNRNSDRKLLFELKNFDVSTVNAFTKNTDAPLFGGRAEGTLNYLLQEGRDRYYSDLDIRDFHVEGDTIGDLSIFIANKPGSDLQHLRIYIDKGLLDSLRIEGDIDYRSKIEALNLYAFLPPTDLGVFEPYMSGVMRNMRGVVFTKDSLHITGNLKEPVLEGEIDIRDAEVVVDYLNVPLKFSARILSDRNRFTFVPFTFYDDRSNKGKARGYIFHKFFTEFNLNLNLWEFSNFHVLNTGPADNSLYYGQGYASGNASFDGPFDNLRIKVAAKTMPGTRFYLPISEGEASGLPGYVHFKTHVQKEERVVSESALESLELDIEATEDAEVEIIFDEILGDKITGTGYGNLKMEMNKSGDFYMFGTYTVRKGKYLFTAFDLYNKPFFIRPGGTITWYGDPLDARLDLVAFNTEVADPAPLLTAVTVNSNINAGNTAAPASPPITAESELYLKGNLFSPEVSFGLNFPKLQTEAGNFTSNLSPVINRIKSDKEEVSRQVFSLLLMRKFLPPSFAQAELGLNSAGSTALSSAGTDLLSSQLSNWLNRIDPNWKVNIIYKNGTITLPTEYGLMLSSRFLNDKLSFDGSFSNYSSRPNINFEYRVTKKGNLKIKAYTRSAFNQVNTTSLSTPITTNGVGIVYTKEFNVLRPFAWLRSKKNKNRKKRLPK